MIEFFPGFGHVKYSLVFTVFEILNAYGCWIAVAQIDLFTFLRRNLRGQDNPYTWCFHAVLIGSDSMNVGGMGQGSPGIKLELVPLNGVSLVLWRDFKLDCIKTFPR